MKISALENLILTQLGNNNQQRSETMPVKQSYPTPVVSGNNALSQQPTEVHDVVKIPNERYTTNNSKPIKKEEEITARAQTVSQANSTNHKDLTSLLNSFVEGKDYIKLPQGQKVLLKQACYRIINFFKMRISVDLIDKKIEPPSELIAYTVCVKLLNEDGSVVFETLSSANSNEKRFKSGGIANDSTVIVMAQSRGLRTCARWLLHR